MVSADEILTFAPEPVAPARYPMRPGAPPIQSQAVDIITAILEDPAPGLEEVKMRLRKCLADHPGRPELALLAHLMETSTQVNTAGGKR